MAESQKRALARIAALRYGNNDYFVVQDMNNVVIMHPLMAQLVGKNMTDIKDANGKAFGAEMGEIVKKSGSGFIDYVWPRPGSDKPLPKLSYVVGFRPGTGSC